MLIIASCSIAVGLFTCIVSVVTSAQIINNEASNKLSFLTQNEANKLGISFIRVEGSVDNLYNFIVATIDVKKLENDPNYAARYIKQFDPIIKRVAGATKSAIGGYLYFNPEITSNKVQAVWYARSDYKGPLIKQKIENVDAFTPENSYMDWYYDAFNAKKAVWSETYLDEIAHIYALPYTRPIFINNKFIGVVGIDVGIDDIKKEVTGVKFYRTGCAYLLDSKYRFVASKIYSNDQTLKNMGNGYFRFLTEKIEKSDNGIVEYQDHINKNSVTVISYSRLPSGFILVTMVPKEEIFEQSNDLKLFVAGITILGLVLAAIIIFNL